MKIKAVIKGTYGKTREYEEIDILPQIGDEWEGCDCYATVEDVVCVNDEVAETTSGDPKADYTFYRIDIQTYEEIVKAYVFVDYGYNSVKNLEYYIKRLKNEHYSDEINEEFDDFLAEFDSIEDFKEAHGNLRWFWNDAKYSDDRDYVYAFFSAM